MTESYKYKILKGSWGIAIDLKISFTNGPALADAVVVAPGIWMLVKTNYCSKGDRIALRQGLEMVAEQIRVSFKSDVTVNIDELKFSPTDFQEEGLVAAIAECVAKELRFDPPAIGVSFDRKANRYVFDFNRS